MITEDDGGYLHEKNQKEDEKIYYMQHGKYTTCDLEEPHFLLTQKIKIDSRRKNYHWSCKFSFRQFTHPFDYSFWNFPIHNERSSGIIMPTYGESATLGYHLRDLGYHFSLNEH